MDHHANPGDAPDPRAADTPDTPTADILLVEDDEMIRLLVETGFQGEARMLHAVTTLEEAQAALDRRRFDAVILDLFLPDGDGRRLLRQIRDRPTTANLPVLILSARGSRGVKLECFRMGADEFFEKPFDPHILSAAVGRQLERARTASAESRRDPVTNLANRAALAEWFDELRAMAARTDHPLAIAFLEVDGWRALLDGLGRVRFERLLASLGGAMSETLREIDVLGRWEGAGFLVFLPGLDPRAAGDRLETTLGEVRSRDLTDPGEEPVHLTFSAGVVDGRRFEDLQDAVMEAERPLLDTRGGDTIGVVVRADSSIRRSDEDPRVLLVEDDSIVAELVQHRLAHDGLAVERFETGREAEELFATESAATYDLIVLDLKLPGVDGFELLRLKRDRPAWRDVPVVILTALGRESEIVRAFELGADDYVLKPFSPIELLARIHRLLKHPRGGG